MKKTSTMKSMKCGKVMRSQRKSEQKMHPVQTCSRYQRKSMRMSKKNHCCATNNM